jgi:hypothetical protein
MQNGETYPQSYGEIFAMIICETYCRRPVVTVAIRANDYGKITLDAEEGTHLTAPSSVIG